MSMTQKDPANYTVDALDTALELVNIIAEAPGHGVTELARRCGQTKARTFRLLWTLEQRGVIVRAGQDATYRLGHAALIWGAAAATQNDLVRVAQPLLKALGEETSETTKLRIRDGLDCVTVAKWEPDRELRCHSLVGRRHPLQEQPALVLLAYAEPDIQREVLGSLPPAVARDRAEALARIREQGFNVTRSEFDGARESISIAAPVFDQTGMIAASIAVAAPASRMDEARQGIVAAALRKTVRHLSSALGHRHTF